MKVAQDEVIAIRQVIQHGRTFGFGNLISHLQTAWARTLMEKYDMGEEAARLASGGVGYPFLMQDDVLDTGEWDETGARYVDPRKKR